MNMEISWINWIKLDDAGAGSAAEVDPAGKGKGGGVHLSFVF
jgi:hypothetical protein